MNHRHKHKHNPELNLEEATIEKLLVHIARMQRERIYESLERFGIQKTYGRILKELSINEGMTQKELAGTMHITAPSMSVSLQKMEAAELLNKKSDDMDLRQIRLYLTDKGKVMARKADREIESVGKKLTETLSHNEEKELRRLLVKIYENQVKGKGEDEN